VVLVQTDAIGALCGSVKGKERRTRLRTIALGDT